MNNKNFEEQVKKLRELTDDISNKICESNIILESIKEHMSEEEYMKMEEELLKIRLARDKEYEDYMKANEGKQVIGWNPENFWPLFES